MTETYYTVLEVPRSASAEEIRDAFIRLMRQVHPDLLANVPEYWKKQAEEKSKDITEAYRVLSDAEARGSYDQQLDAYQQAQGSQPRAASGAQDDSETSQTNSSAAASWSSAAFSRFPARSWLAARLAAVSNLPRGRVAAVVCILMIVALVWPLVGLILGRRAGAPEGGAAPAIQTQSKSQSGTPGAAGHVPLATHLKSSKKPNAPVHELAIEIDSSGEEGSASRTAHDGAPEISTASAASQTNTASTPSTASAASQYGAKPGGGGQVMQWNAQTRSWQRSKSSSTGGAVGGVQAYLQWDSKTNSWQITHPVSSRNAASLR